MYGENCEDDDVVLEGSELHQTLVGAGCTNFDLALKPTKIEVNEMPSKIPEYITPTVWYNRMINDHSFKDSAIKLILEANILLDDHNLMLQELHFRAEEDPYSKYFHWLPVIGSALGIAYFSCAPKEKNIFTTLATSAVFGTLSLRKLVQWRTTSKLKQMVRLQTQLHSSSRQGLKILRRTSEQPSGSLGGLKQNICFSLRQLMFEMFENLASAYFDEAKIILEMIPKHLRASCFLTDLNEKDKDARGIEDLKSHYYTYVLLQSEAMLVFAYAFRATSDRSFFYQNKLISFIDIITSMLKCYHNELEGVLRSYRICNMQPIERVHRRPSSKWQDVYTHLSLTSCRLQLAYNDIIFLLDHFDAQQNESQIDLQLVNEKIDESYKHIETARSFAEFSSLLIAKVQCKREKLEDSVEEMSSLAEPESDKIVVIDKTWEIEDEVFEEYIKEEYLKPLSEVCTYEAVKNFELDKILKKNFMSELKEALIEKQKSMNEREMKALRKMYNKVKSSQDSKFEQSIESFDINSQLVPENKCHQSSTPLHPRPELPMPRKCNGQSVELNYDIGMETRTPVPLPRVKTMDSENEAIANAQIFCIKDFEKVQNLGFRPGFKMHEETFLGSGENSEEEIHESDDSEQDLKF